MVESSQQLEASQGCGSIWNKNSWHWEERNYTEVAKKWLTENLIKISVDSSEHQVFVRLYEVKLIEGNASITIRKQKQIFLFEFKLEIYFDSADKTGAETDKRQGRVLIEEFNQDDADNDIDMNIVCEIGGDLTNRTKKCLTTEVKKEILRVIGELRGELKNIDANEEKLRKDAFEREQALKNY